MRRTAVRAQLPAEVGTSNTAAAVDPHLHCVAAVFGKQDARETPAHTAVVVAGLSRWRRGADTHRGLARGCWNSRWALVDDGHFDTCCGIVAEPQRRPLSIYEKSMP